MESAKKADTLLRLYRYLFHYKKTIVIVLFIMAVTIGISLLNPLMVERAVDVHIKNGDMESLVKLVVIAVILNLIYVVGVRVRMLMMARISNQIVLDIREKLYEHIQTLSFQFFDSRPTGKILARIIGDVNSLKDVLSDSVTTLIPDFLTILAVLGIMMAKNWKLAMSAVITFPLVALGMFITMSLGHKRWQVYRKKNSNLNAYVHENFSGIRIVQSFCAEEESEKSFRKLLNDAMTSWIRAVAISDTFGPLIEITWGLGAFLLYFIGIRIMGVGNVEVGTFMAFSTYLGMFWQPIRNLANFYNKIVTNISCAERVFDIMDTQPDIKDKEGVIELPDVKGEVTFENVDFAYPDEPDRKILNHVNFTIKPGETVALVGPTGAGKTTIVSLISRFYEVTGGRVLIDGYDVNQVSLHSLRRQMGIMTQENYLFSGTIRDNIRYGRMDATDEEIESAAKAVHAHDFIMKLEKGYDTELRDRGSSLSIGQRQLLAFARTMVSMPSILILDEATSSIDTHTELLVQKGIEALLKGRTSFVIAHRLSTIKKADHIFVIDNGNIMEAGTHRELLEKRGAYYQLYEAQFKNLA